jgi:very-short-patch-repair endonuclease
MRKVRQVAKPPGRPVGVVPLVVARDLRARATPQERKLWQQLRALRAMGLHFRRQVPVGTFVVDFACLKERIVVELDGGQHSRGAEAARDARRDAALGAMGFRVRRFWNAEIDANLDGVVETILAAAGRSVYVERASQ